MQGATLHSYIAQFISNYILASPRAHASSVGSFYKLRQKEAFECGQPLK